MNRIFGRKAFWLAATSLAGSAVLYHLDEPLPREKVELSHYAQARLRELDSKSGSPTLSFTATPFNMAASAIAIQEIPAATNQPVSIRGISTEEINLSRYFYGQFAKAKLPKEKIDNLRWALEQYGHPDTETFEKASLGLGIDKTALIKMFHDAALNLFKEQKSPDVSASSLEKLNFWNDRRLAYIYAGLDAKGTYSEATAYTNTGVMKEALERQEYSHLRNAVFEIKSPLVEKMTSIDTKSRESSTQECDEFCGLQKIIDTLPLAEKIQYRDQLTTLRYAIENGYVTASETELGDKINLYLYIKKFDSSIESAFKELSDGMTIHPPPPQSGIPSTGPS